MSRITVLAAVEYYLPGFKGGGPVRSLSNLVERLGADFRFKIVTRDRDVGDNTPYPDIISDAWQRVGQAEVFYGSSGRFSLAGWRELLASTEYDVLYLNSFFSPRFTLEPLLLRKLRLVNSLQAP